MAKSLSEKCCSLLQLLHMPFLGRVLRSEYSEKQNFKRECLKIIMEYCYWFFNDKQRFFSNRLSFNVFLLSIIAGVSKGNYGR